MLACVKTDQRQVEMLDVPEPTPGPGQIVVRSTLTTVCGSDLHFADEYSNDLLGMLWPSSIAAYGVPMGHEAVGIVYAVGAGVQRLREGDRVTVGSLSSCGDCTPCLRGERSICDGGGELLFGAQAELFVVSYADATVARIPEAITDEQAILPTDIMSVGFAAVERAEAGFGDSVAIFAQGPVGLCATAAARARGCGLVIAVDTLPYRLERAKEFGANVVINAVEEDAVERVMELTGGKGVDVAIEAVGTKPTFEACTKSVKKGGTISSVGVYAGSTQEVAMATTSPSFLHRTVVTTLAPTGRHRLKQLMQFMEHGNVDLSGLFTHHMPLREAPEAYELFRQRKDDVLKIGLRT